jgi:hypothetical protein
MRTRPLPRTTPSARSVDGRGVAAFVEAMEAQPRIELHSLMLVRHGDVVAEAW